MSDLIRRDRAAFAPPLSVADIRQSIEASRTREQTSPAEDVFDRIEARLDAMRALVDREQELERWLRENVMAGHAEYLEDPGKAVPAEDVLARIKARREAAEAS